MLRNKSLYKNVLKNHNTINNKRNFIKPAYELAKKIMPKISNTEAAALNAGK